MSESLVLQLAGVIGLGLLAQWLAWRIALPSILLLLLSGLLAGPITGWIDPDAIFGDLLTPMVSLSVALILYEGGLTLKVSELPKVGKTVLSLVTLGAAVTWVLTTFAAHLLLGLQLSTSILLGAVLIVTGPTVVTPLLRHIHPTGSVGTLIRWEGIVIDPIGALATVLVYEAVIAHHDTSAAASVVWPILKTVFMGGAIGVGAAGLLVLALKRFWIPDFLQNPMSLMLVLAAFTGANSIQHEAGLFAVTVMGFAVANQKWVSVEQIVEFKEALRVLLISILFVVLAARLELEGLKSLAWSGTLFVLALILIIRPVSVFASTIGAPLMLREKCFLSWMAPRGIVAAAIASVFALRLEAVNHPDAGVLVSATFMAIIATVTVYGLTSPRVARWLGVAEASPQGVLFVGASPAVQAIAKSLQDEGFSVLLVDTNWRNINQARLAGLHTYAGSILAEHTEDLLDFGGIGRALVMTSNEWINILAVKRLSRIFGKSACFQIPPYESTTDKRNHRHLQGRWAFGEEATHYELERRIAGGYVIKVHHITEQFNYDAFREMYGESAMVLFTTDGQKRLRIATSGGLPRVKPGDTMISLVKKSA